MNSPAINGQRRESMEGLLIKSNRKGGFALLELMIAMTLLTVGILGILLSMGQCFRGNEASLREDDATVAFMETLERLRTQNLAELYSKYQGKTIPARNLISDSGNLAMVRVNFFVNETTLPAEFGALWDLDGDGELSNPNVSGSYYLLPTRLDLFYQGVDGYHARSLWTVIGPR